MVPPVLPRKKPHRPTKVLALVLALVLVVGIATPFFFHPQVAQALPGEGFAVAQWTYIKNKIETAIRIAKNGALELAFKNALRTYFTQLAQDTAIRLTTSGPGQGPLFHTDKAYYEKLANGAAGDFLDTLGTSALGVNVCKPANIHAQFSLQQGLEKLANKAFNAIDPNVDCNKKYNTAITTDKFIVGQGPFDPQYTTVTTYAMTLPQAKRRLSMLYGAKSFPAGAQYDCSGNNLFDNTLCPASVTTKDLTDGTLSPFCAFTNPSGHSLGECTKIYENDITQYQKTADAQRNKCVQSSQPRVQRCTAQDIFNNYQQLGKPLDLVTLTTYFDPGENDIDSLFTLQDTMQQKADQAQQEEQTAANADYTALRDPVTGNVLTPKSTVVGTAGNITKDASGEINKISTPDSLWADVRDVFLTTLVQRKSGLTQKLLDLVFKKGVQGGAGTKNNVQIINGKLQPVTGGLQAAQAIITSLLQPVYNTGGTSTSIDDLAACPDSNPGPNNCVINQGFQQAIQQGLTVQEALDQHLLDGSQPFGFASVGSSASDAVEPDFRAGIPYRSILIMRRLRIVPVGWELAAQYIRDFGGCSAASQPNQRSICTLQQVVDAYNACDTTNGGWSPFCGLIDPQWVLKAPATFCAVSGSTADFTSNDYFPDPVYPDAPQVRQIGRVESCVDEKTCLKEDDQGRCQAYGYCLQEQPTWKFGGTQCTNYYHSCDTFSLGDGQQASYLTNSLDYSTCSAANAGCAWYCRDTTSTGVFTCTDTAGNKDYLTSAAQECPSTEAGCTQYLQTINGSNLIANGGFESHSDAVTLDDGVADDYSAYGWSTTGLAKVEAVSDAYAGSAAARVTEGVSDRLTTSFAYGAPLNGQAYTLTFYAKTIDPSLSCAGNVAGLEAATNSGTDSASQTFDTADSWQRFVQTATFDPTQTFTDNILHVYFSGSTGGCSFMLDNVQLEAGSSYTDYKDYGSANKLYLNGQRTSCTAADVGCDLYTSATDQVPAIATTADSCPADQVGCRAFLEVPVTNNGTNANIASRTGKRCSLQQSISCSKDGDCAGNGSCVASVSLIPTTGTQCDAASVGCEEYTNLDKVAEGGEGTEYYTYIRPCVKPGADANHEKTFYTWVGSDQLGYQLQSYELKSTDDTYQGETSNGVVTAIDTTNGGPAYIDGANDLALGTPQTLKDGLPVRCSESIFNDASNLNWTPDCRQFYDSSLNVFFRLYSRTVTISNDCHPMRNTLDGATYYAIPSEGTTCSAADNLCREYRGPAGYNTRNLINDNFDDGDYAGWTGGKISSQSLIFGGSSLEVPPPNDDGSFSDPPYSPLETDSTVDIPHQIQQGRSYILTFWAASAKFCDGTADNPCPTIAASFAGGSETFAGTALAKWSGGTTGIPEWNAYTLGPLNLLRAPVVTGGTVDNLRISGDQPFYIDNIQLQEVADSVYLIKNTSTLCAGHEGCDKYTNRGGATSYLKSFTKLCSQDKVGCEALVNTQNSDSPFSQSFANGTDIGGPNADGTNNLKVVPADSVQYVINDPAVYCHEENQGCTLLGQPILGQANSTCANDPTKRCDPSNAANTLTTCGTAGLCQILTGSTTGKCLNNRTKTCTADSDCGTDNLCQSQNVTVQQYSSVYRIEDPEQYGTNLCMSSEIGCNAWTDTRTNTTQYFRNPDPYTCEYKTVTINGQQVSGWYKSGTSGLSASDTCPGLKSPAPAAASGIVPVVPYSQPTNTVCKKNSAKSCTQDSECGSDGPCIHWAGICHDDQAGCTEYRDQNDPTGCFSQCLLTVDQTYGDTVPVNSSCLIQSCSITTSKSCNTKADGPAGESCKLTGLGTCSKTTTTSCARDADCPAGESCAKKTGCRGYYYLSQSVEEDASQCNGVANDEQGCKTFYTTDSTSITAGSTGS